MALEDLVEGAAGRVERARRLGGLGEGDERLAFLAVEAVQRADAVERGVVVLALEREERGELSEGPVERVPRLRAVDGGAERLGRALAVEEPPQARLDDAERLGVVGEGREVVVGRVAVVEGEAVEVGRLEHEQAGVAEGGPATLEDGCGVGVAARGSEGVGDGAVGLLVGRGEREGLVEGYGGVVGAACAQEDGAALGGRVQVVAAGADERERVVGAAYGLVGLLELERDR